MPIIRSAIKKVRKDKIRTARNKRTTAVIKSLLKKTRLEPSAENLKTIFSALDRAVKTNLIHKNKASRLKSRLSKSTSNPSVTNNSKASRLKSRLSKGINTNQLPTKKSPSKK